MLMEKNGDSLGGSEQLKEEDMKQMKKIKAFPDVFSY